VALLLKVHPSNYRVEGFTAEVPVAALATLGVPVLADIGSGLLDATCPWLPGPPPPWLHSEPAARQTLAAGAALVAFSGDKLLGGPQCGVLAGRADLVAGCARHPLLRALRPGHLVLAALQDVLLAYLRRDLDALPFWRLASLPVADLRSRAEAVVAAAGCGSSEPLEALPGAGSLPGTTIPSWGVVVAGDHLDHLRAASPPVLARVRDGRTACDLRTVEPRHDAHLAGTLAGLA
jgi:L-seryl-tRNA(Ser) seleniumtransferase